ncbi:MAG: phospho-N-acetylmuramoyl-pentapeptide-transferase [Muribaculaceae bacterium]|nr:phospho-N-acetylmuramoyl-pentapeptide-transferase [Muribaculaceae bacterium]MDE5967770.1 phospho-N-acetylmuramoyl-pentapeptide-transferase [Muribaculaceae bacterium]
MLYFIFEKLQDANVPGARLMDYITFRSVIAMVLSLFIATIIGRRIINRLQMMQIGDIVRNLGVEGQMKKIGTPTMGGIIIILSILVPCLLVGNLSNIYMILLLVSTVWLGVIGFLDDYMKIKKHNKDGLKGKFKIVGQVGLGLIVGFTMWLSPDITIRENHEVRSVEQNHIVEITYEGSDIKSNQTTIPFVKEHNFAYSDLTKWVGDKQTAETAGWILFILVTIFIITATSNGANLMDGLDGLTTGCSAIIGVALAAMAYLGGSVLYSSYLNIMYIPGSGEMVVYMSAFIGALIGFLWYNAYPAQVFMGDTGSLTLGGIIAVFAILIHKEFLLPVLCLLFYIEDLSVILQVITCKITRRRTGTMRRMFKMTPLHHHFQKVGDGSVDAIIQRPYQAVPESKIVIRFWIVGIILAALTFVSLKIR